MTLTTLRQLPDVVDPARSALTEIVEIPIEDVSVGRFTRLGGGWTVACADTGLHPIARDLGVPRSSVARFAAEVRVDFTLGCGRVLARPAPERLVVLGGGLASLSAVFELTSQPGWSSRWDIEVVQPGWRLGGKAASSRNRQANDRSEEHGLHVWFGFYRNAFGLVRRVYEALDRPAGHPVATAEAAFAPQSRVRFHEDDEIAWIVDYPESPGLPGGADATDHALTAMPSVRSLLQRLLDVVVGALRGRPVMRPALRGRELPAPSFRRLLLRALAPGRFSSDLTRIARRPSRPTLQRLRARVRRLLVGHEHLALHQLGVVLDSALTMALGMVVDRLVSRGFDAIDDEDFRTWLRRHGAPREVIESAPLKALYDAAFAYERGDPARPDLAAGAALLTVLRMVLTYEGALLWKTTVGMGEAIVAPLYEVLAARGVRFRFFHRVDALRLSAAGDSLDAVDLSVQARVRGAYEPLVDVAGVQAWPSRPRMEQLEEADGLEETDASWVESGVEDGPCVERLTLERGVDFDRVLLGIGLGALPRVTAELAARHRPWAAMLGGLEAVRTGAVQYWLRDESDGLAAIDNLPCGPFASWIDMRQLLPHEGWTEQAPRGLVYGAGVLPDDPDADECAARAARSHALHPGPRDVLERFERVNRHGSELYERAATGTARHRLAPDESGVRNLVLTGAWTYTGFHIGSVEAAVMSGRLAASVIDGVPRLVVGARRRDA